MMRSGIVILGEKLQLGSNHVSTHVNTMLLHIDQSMINHQFWIHSSGKLSIVLNHLKTLDFPPIFQNWPNCGGSPVVPNTIGMHQTIFRGASVIVVVTLISQYRPKKVQEHHPRRTHTHTCTYTTTHLPNNFTSTPNWLSVR